MSKPTVFWDYFLEMFLNMRHGVDIDLKTPAATHMIHDAVAK